MGRAAVVVDIHAVRRVGEHVALRAQFGKQRLRGHRGGTVRAVQRNAQAFERVFRHRTLHMIHIIPQCLGRGGNRADLAAGGELGLFLVIEHDRLDLLLERVGQLIAGAAENLDAVEFAGVVRSGDHHTRVGPVLFHQVGHRRGRHYAQMHHIRADAAKARGQRAFKHVGGNARVLADQDFRMALAAFTQYHRCGAADIHRQLTR